MKKLTLLCANVGNVLLHRIELLIATGEVIHCSIYTKNCAKNKIKNPKWQNILPKTDKMKAKWDSSEYFIVFNLYNYLTVYTAKNKGSSILIFAAKVQ